MKKIIAARGIGKTTQLINEARQAVKEGYSVIFISPSKQICRILRNKYNTEDYKDIEFITMQDYGLKTHGRRNFKVFIDELDYCILSMLCVNSDNVTYTLTIQE